MEIKNKILINATYASERPTGIGVFTSELISNLVKINPDLFHVLCSYDFVKGYEKKKILNRKFASDLGPKGHLNRIMWSQTGLAYEYFRSDCNLLFSTLPEAPVIIKNKIVVVHDIIPVKFKDIKTKMRYNFKYVVPNVLKTAKYLVFDSEFTRNDVYEYYKLRNIPSSVIQLGYNKELFHPVEKGYIKKKYGYDNYFFYVGDIRPYKNLENSIRAFAKADLDDVIFIIAGKRDERYFPALTRTVADLSLGNRVVFVDYIAGDELPHFYGNALALFFPSLYEGFGLPPLEAMAMGTPVITTRMASLPEVCGDAAVYVNPDDIEAMAGALKEIATNNTQRKTYSEKSLQRAKLFSWEKAAKEYLQVFSGVLDEK